MQKIIRILLLFITFNLTAQTNNLSYYLNFAKLYNPALKEDGNQIKINTLEQQKIKSQYNKPQIYYTTNLMKAPIFNGYGYDVAISNGALISSQVNIQQQLLSNAIIKTKIKQQIIKSDNYKNDSNTTLHNLTLQITQLYIQCYFNQKLIANDTEIYNNFKKQQAILNNLYQHGIADLTDLKLLDTELSSQLLAIKSLMLTGKQNLNLLNQLCGINDTSASILIKPNIVKSASTISFENSFFNKKFEIDSLKIENEKNNFNQKYKPQLFLFGDAGVNAISFNGIEKNFGFSGGINLYIPIYDGKQKMINSQQTAIRQVINQDYKNYNQNQIQLQAQSLTQQINLINNQLLIVKKQQIAYQKLLKLYNLKLKNGLIKISDYLIFSRTYIATKTKEIKLNKQKMLAFALYNYLNW